MKFVKIETNKTCIIVIISYILFLLLFSSKQYCIERKTYFINIFFCCLAEERKTKIMLEKDKFQSKFVGISFISNANSKFSYTIRINRGACPFCGNKLERVGCNSNPVGFKSNSVQLGKRKERNQNFIVWRPVWWVSRYLGLFPGLHFDSLAGNHPKCELPIIFNRILFIFLAWFLPFSFCYYPCLGFLPALDGRSLNYFHETDRSS